MAKEALAVRLDERGAAPAIAPPSPSREQPERLAWAREGAALVLETSGTSGTPKRVALGLSQLVASAEASNQMLGTRADDRWLLCMPLFHVGGLSILTRSLLAGTGVVLQDGFDAARVARALDEEGVTAVSFVATMLARVLAERGRRPSPPSLRLVLLGGGPAPASLLARAAELGYPIAPTYGLTEAASQVATRPPGERALDGDPAGGLRALPGVAIRIVDPGGQPQPANVEGEIQLRGPIVMSEYLGDPVATGRALRDGWLATGDIGRLDQQGRLRVLDRRRDLIVAGGENVYPAEIESVLVTHPAVLEAGVVGREDAEFGARPVAFCVMTAGAAPGGGELEAHCRDQLASYKCPVAFYALTALPRTASGKLRRDRLAARLAEGRDAPLLA